MRNERKQGGLHPVEIHRSIITTDCPHFGAIKGLEHLPNGVFAENSIGIHVHDELTIGIGGAGVQRSPFAGILLIDKDHGIGVGLGEVPHHLGGTVGGPIIDHDEFEVLVAAGQNRADAGAQHFFLVIAGDDDAHEGLIVQGSFYFSVVAPGLADLKIEGQGYEKELNHAHPKNECAEPNENNDC